MIVKRSDVAKKANVSPAVVSYVINNSNYVSEAKRQAVLKAIKELDYKPDYLAQSFKTRRTHHIALISDDLHNEYFNELADVTEQAAFKRGYFLSLFSNRQTSLNVIARRCMVDGVFLFTTKYRTDDINELADSNIPTVLCDSIEYFGLSPKINRVSLNLESSMKEMTDCLIKKGHKKIIYISAAPIISMNNENFRFKGFLSALKDNEIKPDMNLVFSIRTEMNSLVNEVLNYFQKDNKPTLIIAGNDSIALRLMGRLQRLGYRIPDDVAIVGAGNIELGQYCNPPLTTFDYHNGILADKVISNLWTLREGKKVDNLTINIDLVMRGSA